MENQLDSVTEKPICFLRLQGLTCDWSKHNKHSRNIFSVHGFLRLSVTIISLNHILSQKTFFVNFYICHFDFLFFSPLVTGSLRGGRGGGGREGGGQGLGLRVEKREGGVREAEKRAGRKS